jgi:hypothetical protein
MIYDILCHSYKNIMLVYKEVDLNDTNCMLYHASTLNEMYEICVSPEAAVILGRYSQYCTRLTNV